MSQTKDDASEGGRVGQRSKHLRPPADGELVVVSAAQLEALIQRAVHDALGAEGSGPMLVDKQSLARKLGCSATHIDNLRKRGLPCVPVGQAVRFEPPRVLEWLRAQQIENDSE